MVLSGPGRVRCEANFVEGYALGTTPLFKRHLRIAFGSAAEAECLLRAAAEVAYLELSTAQNLEKDEGATMRALKGLMRAELVLPAE